MSPAILICEECGDAYWADRQHNCHNDCQDCDGQGRIWNNADPTSGQWIECETPNPSTPPHSDNKERENG